MSGCERAVFVVKPDGVSKRIGRRQLPELIGALLQSVGLQINEEIRCQLSERNVRDMYPILAIPDPIYGEEWKKDLIEHLTSEEVIAYHLTGEEAEKKAKIIKRHLRDVLADPTTERGRVIENVAHVADEDDYEVTCSIFDFKQ
jgi:nucleoside diphosphate kinase